MLHERNEQIKVKLKRMIEKFDDAGMSNHMLRSFDDYLFHRKHLDRLLYMLDLLLPYCQSDKRIADLGSNIVFPYLVRLCSVVQVCDGIAWNFGRCEHFIFREDGTTSITPLDDPNTDIGEESGILVPIHHCDLSRDQIPYGNASFDILTCYETLEHLRCDPMNLMSEANRTLKSEGIFMLTTPNANSISNLTRMIRYESPNFYPPYNQYMDSIEHVKEYSIQEIRLLFESAGFEIIRLETFDHVNSNEFNHNEAYQINYLDADEPTLQKLRAQDDELKHAVMQLLAKDGFSHQYRGDYILVFAKKVSDVKDRYCFPIYEKSEL
ncbi:methyltransferase domain-containing protein [Paenibacillus hexagrammi]|uniref:Class I SAM-dependent methyltransferase n=1 Tax=Paenibacillus hexagrammi TaxID=2908839 RepID=A0ABY3SFB0_9BACL|nr:methyltransferase domain-containing protein [Paenibacillus sp. YPD9-1]UJF31876.1 class I SAM-dependent methyltransferase [Paenibacillus sp. YPD9-1]